MLKFNTTLFLIVFHFTSILSKDYNFIIGTYTRNTESKGIYSIQINPEKQTSRLISIAEGIENPSFITLSSNRQFVYSVSEDGSNSVVAAYHFQKGKFKFLNSSKMKGEGSCYIDECKGVVSIANYRSGNLVYFKLNNNHSIPSELNYMNFEGSSIQKDRQEKSHLHQSIYSPDRNYLFTNNLGTDYTHMFRFDAENKNSLEPLDSIKAILGGGPRHLAFNPKLKLIYVLYELSGQIATISYDNDQLSLIDTVSIIKHYKGKAGAADIHITHDGKYLYATNREAYNSISSFRISKNGKLTLLCEISTEGNWPRNFAISKDDKYVFIAHQKSNDICVFERDKKTGKLKFTDFKIQLPSPVCMVEY